MKMEIKIDTIGEIMAGDEAGSFVKVVNDTDKTGGFLILTSSTPDMKNGFDNWVENENSLKRYFVESSWVVRWL